MVVHDKEVRFVDEEDQRAQVDRSDQVPQFADEEAERAWWSEHTLSDEFWNNAPRVPDADLPPVRAPASQDGASTAVVPGGGPSTQQALCVGIAVGAATAVGLWLLYRLVNSGGVAALGEVLPNR